MKDPSTILRSSTEQLPPNYMTINGNKAYNVVLLLDSYHRRVIGVDPIPAASWILRHLSTFHTDMALHKEYCRLHPAVTQDQNQYSKLLNALDEGIIWLQKAGLVRSPYPGYAVGTHCFTVSGRDAHFLMLRYCRLCRALNFLIDAKKSVLRFGSADEERLNIMLAGHSEWLKHDWFVRNASWVKEAASLLGGWTNLTVTSAWINVVQVWKKWSSNYDT